MIFVLRVVLFNIDFHRSAVYNLLFSPFAKSLFGGSVNLNRKSLALWRTKYTPPNKTNKQNRKRRRVHYVEGFGEVQERCMLYIVHIWMLPFRRHISTRPMQSKLIFREWMSKVCYYNNWVYDLLHTVKNTFPNVRFFISTQVCKIVLDSTTHLKSCTPQCFCRLTNR